MNKWDRGAQLLNSYRVFPRIWLGAYYVFFMGAWFYVVEWFTGFDWNALPSDPIVGAAAAAANAGFPAIILGILSKILMELTKSYWNGSSTQGQGH
jgi:hypothetical protein